MMMMNVGGKSGPNGVLVAGVELLVAGGAAEAVEMIDVACVGVW